VTVVHNLKPIDPPLSIRFYNQMRQNVHKGLDQQLLFITEEAYFNLTCGSGATKSPWFLPGYITWHKDWNVVCCK